MVSCSISRRRGAVGIRYWIKVWCGEGSRTRIGFKCDFVGRVGRVGVVTNPIVPMVGVGRLIANLITPIVEVS
jgi:hypothetical protein